MYAKAPVGPDKGSDVDATAAASGPSDAATSAEAAVRLGSLNAPVQTTAPPLNAALLLAGDAAAAGPALLTAIEDEMSRPRSTDTPAVKDLKRRQVEEREADERRAKLGGNMFAARSCNIRIATARRHAHELYDKDHHYSEPNGLWISVHPQVHPRDGDGRWRATGPGIGDSGTLQNITLGMFDTEPAARACAENYMEKYLAELEYEQAAGGAAMANPQMPY